MEVALAERIDNAMVHLGLAQSRERAKALITEGLVFLNGVQVQKASDRFYEGQIITVYEDPIPFVSRGGLKLRKAIDNYHINLKERICIDVGASTGGFTDCMLTYGARKVYAVDVGYDQLNLKLKNDSRVVCMERHNARYMESSWFEEIPSFASVDVSFISIKLILPRLAECLSADGEAVILVKPQFEAGRGRVGKNGVVRESSVHEEILIGAASFAIENGFKVKAIDYSPITGPKGNIEFLMYLSRCDGVDNGVLLDENIKQTVMFAHKDLD